MTLPFAVVTVGKTRDGYGATAASVTGLGGIHERTSAQFRRAAAGKIFGEHPNITSVCFTGARGGQVRTVQRKPESF